MAASCMHVNVVMAVCSPYTSSRSSPVPPLLLACKLPPQSAPTAHSDTGRWNASSKKAKSAKKLGISAGGGRKNWSLYAAM